MRKKLRKSIKNQNNLKLDVLQSDFVRLKNMLSHSKVAFEDDFLLSYRDHSQQVNEKKI